MQSIDDWKQLNSNLRGFWENLKKDNVARREDESITARKVSELQKFNVYFQELDRKLQSDIESKALDYKTVILVQDLLKRCKNKIDECQVILKDRLGNLEKNVDDKLDKDVGLDIGNVHDNESTSSDHILQAHYTNNSIKMGESFSFKTASALLQKLDGSTDTVHQLIESINFYESSLDADSKTQVINYVLKICLSHRDRIRMKSGYNSVTELVVDLKRNFLPKQSAPSLIAKMQASRQGNLTTDEYGRTIETLMADLTIAQIGEASEVQVIDVITKQNEKLAVDIFAKGLRNREIRTVIKARNYERLSEAISAANEEALSAEAESTVNVIRGKFDTRSQKANGYTNKRYNNNWGNTTSPRFQNKAVSNNRHFATKQNSYHRRYKNQTFNKQYYPNKNYRGGKYQNQGRSHYTSRTFQNSNRMYTAQSEIPKTDELVPEIFFRGPQV